MTIYNIPNDSVLSIQLIFKDDFLISDRPQYLLKASFEANASFNNYNPCFQRNYFSPFKKENDRLIFKILTFVMSSYRL